MIRTERMEQRSWHASGQRWTWPFLCILAVIALFLSLGHATPAHADNLGAQYVTNAASADSDCDGAHASSGTHCCAGVACSAYAQVETSPAAPNDMIGRQPLPIAQSIRIGRSPRPNLQPPKHSSQA
jgi:hypothetical protein